MFNKFKSWISEKKGQLVLAGTSAAAVLFPLTAQAEEITFKEGIETLWTTITGQVNVGNVVAIIGICLGACLALALFWFGIRYVIRKIMSALKKGKVSA